VIFDMDGVVTRTATLHAAAWKRLFDDFLRSRSGDGDRFEEFTQSDYLQYVDGKPRYAGVADFLSSRGITLPNGDLTDPPDRETVAGVGNRKDDYFWQLVDEQGVEAYESTVTLIRRLKEAGLRVGIFSASRNAEAILRKAGVLDLFDAKVDGTDAHALNLPGKPAPAMLLEVTHQLGGSPARTAVIEDAIAGVRAGRAGRFAPVIGVNRSGTPGVLVENGADFEVEDLEEVVLRQ
jgi:alpha,alpha-trehalase